MLGDLERRTRDAVKLGPKLAAAEAVAEQQRRHIERLASEVSRFKAEACDASQRAKVERSLSVQLQAELRRGEGLSSESPAGRDGEAAAGGDDGVSMQPVVPASVQLPQAAVAVPHEISQLELEVVALQKLLAAKDEQLRAMGARERQLLSGTAELVPSSLLAAAQDKIGAMEDQQRELEAEMARQHEHRVSRLQLCL